MMRLSVDRPRVKPLCCGHAASQIWFFYVCDTDVGQNLGRNRPKRYTRTSVFAAVGLHPFQIGRIMARFPSVGMTQYFHMSVEREREYPAGNGGST